MFFVVFYLRVNVVRCKEIDFGFYFGVFLLVYTLVIIFFFLEGRVTFVYLCLG